MYYKIEDDGELNKYIGNKLDRHPESSTNIRNILQTQRINNLILGMDKEISNPTSMINMNPKTIRYIKW